MIVTLARLNHFYLGRISWRKQRPGWRQQQLSRRWYINLTKEVQSRVFGEATLRKATGAAAVANRTITALANQGKTLQQLHQGKTTDGQVNKMTRIPFSSRTFVGINTCCNKFIKLSQSYPVLTHPHTQVQHLQVLINQMDLTISSNCLAGRVAHYVHNWELITQDRWVLQTITGYHLDLVQTPTRQNHAT